MTVQEIMERAGVNDTTLCIAWIKDAINLIQSSYNENVTTWKTDVTEDKREYQLPANMIKLTSLSVKDTGDDKYKRIKRLVYQPTVRLDESP